MMFIVKRSGKREKFDREKVRAALENANNSVLEQYQISRRIINNIIEHVENAAEENETMFTVDDIQDTIEEYLININKYELARSYIKFRYQKELARSKYSELMTIIGDKVACKDIQNQNANLDEKSFGGRLGETTSLIMKQYALDYCVSPKTRENHLNNEVYIHDLDHYAVGDHNCLSIPFDKLLSEGFTTRQTDVRSAGSLSTAMQLVAVIFQLQSLQQFGGVSATHLDHTMVPYVRKSFSKHFRDGLKLYKKKTGTWEVPKELSFTDTDATKYKYRKVYSYAMEMTQKESHQAVEALFHNLNTLQSRSGNQLPFTSINLGTCIKPEGRLVTKDILTVCREGLGKYHRTSIFPCVIFQCMKGVNRQPGDPNYDLFQLALKSTSERLYPNYANVDWSGNVGYDVNDPKTYFSTMGALAGHEHLYVSIDDSTPIDTTISSLFRFVKTLDTTELTGSRPCQIYYNKQKLNNPENRHVQKKSKIVPGPGVYSITYIPEDITYIGSSANVNRRLTEHRCSIRMYGCLDAGVVFGDANLENYRFEVLEYTEDFEEREKFYIQTRPNVNFRGTSHKYYKNVTSRKSVVKTKPVVKQDRTIPQELIGLENMNIKVLDRDNKWVKVKHIFKNDRMNTPHMMHIYYKDDSKVYCLSCTEDHPLWTGEKFTRADELSVGTCLYKADNTPLEIVEIGWHWESVDSYDIGTYSGSFIGSDIIMHNCRTANGYDINAEPGVNPLTKDGRGNICPTTIILPTLAMEADKNVDKFLSILKKKIHDAKDSLIDRFEWICSQSFESARFMYENGTMGWYNPEEGIRSALKHGTLAIGMLGMAETLELLVGCNQTKPEGMQLAKRICQLYKDLCNQFKEEYKLNFGVYFTPAENLCFTAMKKFQDKYGVIDRVSDHEFFTNSMHIPVWENIDAFEKIRLESELTGYSSAGCITYVELDSSVRNNTVALESIVNYAMDHDIPYFAINVPVDICEDCGYQGELSGDCPKCGSNNISRLRRVTGYLTGSYTTAFNKGKQCEVEARVKHTGVEVS